MSASRKKPSSPKYRTKTSRPLSAAEKMRAYRARKKTAGLRLKQMWVPDEGAPLSQADAVRAKLRELGITAADVKRAVRWARGSK